MGGCRRGSGLSAHGHEIRHLEPGARGRCQSQVNGEHVVEAERLDVAQMRFEDGVVNAFGSHLGVGVTKVSQVGDSRFLQVREIATVVHDSHGVCLGESNTDVVAEDVVTGIGGRVDVRSHAQTVSVVAIGPPTIPMLVMSNRGGRMPVHPEYQALLDMMAMVAAGAPPMSETTPEMSRQGYAGLAAVAGPGPEVASVEHLTVPGQAAEIPLRIYRPTSDDEVTGVVVFFHGGGFVIGDLDTHDAVCRELCVGTGCTVIAVDYRLAPEHRFPAAVEDCWDATRWVAEHADELRVDSSRLVVAGDSAGGNLAAVVALLAREHAGPRLALQVLVYPAVDGADGGWQSRIDNAVGYLLTAEQMDWFVDHYVPSVTLRSDWRVAPLRASSHAGLPPALVITAEFDPLRDEGAAYAAALRAARVPVTHSLYEGAIHVFFQLPGSELGRRAMTEVCQAIKAVIA